MQKSSGQAKRTVLGIGSSCKEHEEGTAAAAAGHSRAHCSRKINGGTDENLIFLTFKITHRQDTEQGQAARQR